MATVGLYRIGKIVCVCLSACVQSPAGFVGCQSVEKRESGAVHVISRHWHVKHDGTSLVGSGRSSLPLFPPLFWSPALCTVL